MREGGRGGIDGEGKGEQQEVRAGEFVREERG